MSSIGTKLGVVMGAGVIAMGVLALRSSPDELREETAKGTVDHLKQAPTALRGVSTPPPDTSQRDFEDAMKRGDVAAMNATLARGASATGLLASAVATGKVEVVRVVLDHESVTDDEDGATTELLAADAHPAITKLLLARGAREATLREAIAHQASNAVTRILAKSVTKRDLATGLAALTETSFTDKAAHQRIAVAVLGAGADPNGSDPDDGGTTSFMSQNVSGCTFGDSEPCKVGFVKLLADHGGRLSSADMKSAMLSTVGRPLLDALASAKLECNALAEVKESGPYDADEQKALDRLSKLKRSADCAK